MGFINMNDKENYKLAPPWEKFPTYEKYTIGWRMGTGESYRYEWWEYIESLPKDYNSRLKYLQYFRPAPINWSNCVLNVLYPEIETDEVSSFEIEKLLKLNLIGYDAAYQTWIKQQTDIAWPWSIFNDPIEATRYSTRDFWFFSRQFSGIRNKIDLDNIKIPESWNIVKNQLLIGQLGEFNKKEGLLTLAKMLCSGSIVPPWKLDLKLKDFKDSFEIDMGYSDAYRLWIMSAFDDDKMLRSMISKTEIPKEWETWINEHAWF